MSDIALSLDPITLVSDVVVEDNDLVGDGGLETAVMVSLFCERRAEASDVLPDEDTDRRGWWADELADVDNDKIGSRLWLLARSKATADIPVRAVEYAREALQWLVDDKVADRVEVQSEIWNRGILRLSITLFRPKADPVTFRFNYTWAAQEAQRVS